MERDYPLTVAGAVADLAQALKKASPHSHAADLSIGAPERRHDGGHGRDVNAVGSPACLESVH
jgi:hypothetical protein